MNLKPLCAIVMLSIAFSAQAKPVTKTYKGQTVSAYQAAPTGGQKRLAQASKNMRQVFGKVRDTSIRGAQRFGFAKPRQEREYSMDVPRPILSAEIKAPF